MSRIIIAAICFTSLLLSIPNVHSEAVIILLDDSYSASILGTNKDHFAAPDGIALYRNRLYLADEGGQTVEVWAAGTALRKICDPGAGVLSPEDLVIDEGGSVYFTDDDAGGLCQIDAKGHTRLLAGKDKGLISTEAVALSPDGTILVGDGEQHKVFRVTKQGDVTVLLGDEYGISKPESMAFSESGDLYIADNKNDIIYLLDSKHQFQRLIDGKRLSLSPETIFYSNGILYITDSHAGKVYEYTRKEGLRAIAAFSRKLKNVQGIAVDARGNIYLTVQSDLKNGVGYVVLISRTGADLAFSR